MSEPKVIARHEAAERGLSKFYTGKPCKHGHVTERYTSSGGCIGCLKMFVPKKNGGSVVAKGIAHWPPRAFNFIENGRAVTREDAEATFRYMADQEWHMKALAQLRANPALMAHYGRPPTTVETLKEGHDALEQAFRNLPAREIEFLVNQRLAKQSST